jgi:hypothetical protein
MRLDHQKLAKVISHLLTPLALCIMSIHVMAADCSAKSGTQTVPLLELYTSEGCSSCPPADKWLSGLKLDASKVVALAFHVDYWDYIGWKDKFSKSEFSDRQRRVAALSGAGFVYTPQFIFNGKDFRGWDGSRLNQAVEINLKQPARTHLTLDATNQANDEILIKATARAVKTNDAANNLTKDLKHADIFIAIYENRLVSQVSAGENNGRELKHDYVVREFLGAYQFNHKNEFAKNITLKSGWQGHNAGAVIFVQDARNGEILQSLQLPFCS